MKGIAVRERNIEIDFVKAISIIRVVLVHTCIGGYTHIIGSFNWTSALLLGCISRGSVPLFLMCSGAVLLAPGKELSIKKIYIKYLPRLLTALFFWATAYKLFNLAIKGSLSAHTFLHAIKETLLLNHEPHLYYMHIILLVYAFLPITRAFVKNASKKELLYFLAIWFTLGIAYPTVKVFWPFTLLRGIPVQWLLNMAYASIGYCVLGYFLKTYAIKTKTAVCCLATGLMIVFFGTYLISIKTGELYEHFLEGMTVGVCLLATGIFSLSMQFGHSITLKLRNPITYLSKASFCIYLVHIFFIKLFSLCGITVFFLPSLISIPLIALLNIFCCLVVYFILSHVPVFKKWIV